MAINNTTINLFGEIGEWIDPITEVGYSGVKAKETDISLYDYNRRKLLKVEPINFFKEIPDSTVKVIKGIGQLAKSVQEGIARSGASVGLTLATPFTKAETITGTIKAFVRAM